MAQKPVLRGELGCACVAREVSVEREGMGCNYKQLLEYIDSNLSGVWLSQLAVNAATEGAPQWKQEPRPRLQPSSRLVLRPRCILL